MVGTIEPRIRTAEIERALRKPAENLEAYDLVLRGRWTYEQFGKSNLEEPARLYRRAIALDPNYARPYAHLARALYALAANHWTSPLRVSLPSTSALRGPQLDLGLTTPMHFGSQLTPLHCLAANLRKAFPSSIERSSRTRIRLRFSP